MSRGHRRVLADDRTADLSEAVSVGPELRHDPDPGRSPDIEDAGISTPVVAALEVRATEPGRSGRILTAPLTEAELRVLRLLPTTSSVQMAATLYISRNTVKTHLRSIYQKLGGSSRLEVIQRAVDLRLL
jgi:DNA-binding CsgD family transcriptional regulator